LGKRVELYAGEHEAFEYFTVKNQLIMAFRAIIQGALPYFKYCLKLVLFFFLPELDSLHGVEHVFEVFAVVLLHDGHK
jgi:hypothetical protein